MAKDIAEFCGFSQGGMTLFGSRSPKVFDKLRDSGRFKIERNRRDHESVGRRLQCDENDFLKWECLPLLRQTTTAEIKMSRAVQNLEILPSKTASSHRTAGRENAVHIGYVWRWWTSSA